MAQSNRHEETQGFPMNITTLNTKQSHQSLINTIAEENRLSELGMKLIEKIRPVLRK